MQWMGPDGHAEIQWHGNIARGTPIVHILQSLNEFLNRSDDR